MHNDAPQQGQQAELGETTKAMQAKIAASHKMKEVLLPDPPSPLAGVGGVARDEVKGCSRRRLEGRGRDGEGFLYWGPQPVQSVRPRRHPDSHSGQHPAVRSPRGRRGQHRIRGVHGPELGAI